MKKILYVCAGLLLLVLRNAAGQGQYLLSGNVMQPHICVQRVYADTDMAVEEQQPRLYLLSGNVPAELPVAGTYSHSGDQLCFEPLYPLAEAQRFLLKARGCRDTVISTPAVTAPPLAAAAAVSVYPLADSIPENILFFHVRFTQPMQEDRNAWKKISIRDEQGKVIPGTWRQRSFWLDSSRLLVLMIHPGRVKSGIRYMGPVFAAGHSYTLVVDSSLADAYGRPLAGSLTRRYTAVPEVQERLQVYGMTQKLKADTREPLVIRFVNGVDHAAACTGILMYDAAGRLLPCTVQQYEACTVSIQPRDPWPRGKLRLEFSGALYDCAGNRRHRLFEVKRKQAFRKDKVSEYFPVDAR